MRILWLSEYYPFPPHDGNALPIYHYVRLVARSAQITLLTHRPAELDRQGMGEQACAEWGVELIHVDRPPRSKTAQALACLKAGKWWVNRFYSPPFAAAVRDLDEQHRHDLVVSEGILSAQHVPSSRTMPHALIARDSLSLAHTRRYQATGSRREWLQSFKIATMERALYSRAELVFAISETDAAEMRRLASATRIEMLPNGIDTAHFRPNPAARESNTVVFSGAFDAAANADAAMFLLSEVWPAVSREAREARLVLTGRNPTPGMATAAAEIRKAGGHVEITGKVPDMAHQLQRAEVIVAPLLYGTGLKNKLLEAAATGAGIVATSVSREGLPLRDGHELLVADPPAAIAGAIVRLLRDPGLAARLGAAARACVERDFSWELHAGKLLRQLESVARSPA